MQEHEDKNGIVLHATMRRFCAISLKWNEHFHAKLLTSFLSVCQESWFYYFIFWNIQKGNESMQRFTEAKNEHVYFKQLFC